MEAIKRIVLRLFPELKNRYHLPMLGRVERIGDAPADGGQCTHDRPRYAVDIQPLDRHLKPKGELLRDVTVGVTYAGNARGFYALPDPGTIIEFCFAYGMPNLIFIRGVIPWNLELPHLDKDESRWQQSADIYQGYDKTGNWHRHTTENIRESAAKVRECNSQVKQLLKSPKTWIGSDSENVLRILSDSLNAIASGLNAAASHTHNGGQIGAPDNGGDIASTASTVSSIKSGRLDPITE